MYFRIVINIILCLSMVGCGDSNRSTDTATLDQPITQTEITEPETKIDEPVPEFSGDISYSKAVELTLLNNPALEAFSYEVRAAEAREIQAGVWQNPRLEIEMEEVGGAGERSGFDGAETTVAITQPIELGRKVEKRKRAAELDVKSTEWGYKVKRQQVLTDVSTAFVRVLAANEKKHIAQELGSLSEKIIDTIDRRVKAGVDSRLALSRAKISVSGTKILDRQAEEDVEHSVNVLASFWAGQGSTVENVIGKMSHPESMASLGDLKERLATNPEVLRMAIEIEKSRAELEIAKSKSAGDLKISAGVQRFNETDESAVVLGISFPLPIFDRNIGGRREASYNIAKAKEQERATAIALSNRLETLYREMTKAKIKADELKDNVLVEAKELYGASVIGYEQGKIGLLELIDAQKKLFESKTDYIDALTTYHIARAMIEGMVGDD